ncbi:MULTISPECIES: hypothetical protein [unclassified Nonomuraea]
MRQLATFARLAAELDQAAAHLAAARRVRAGGPSSDRPAPPAYQ